MLCVKQRVTNLLFSIYFCHILLTYFIRYLKRKDVKPDYENIISGNIQSGKLKVSHVCWNLFPLIVIIRHLMSQFH